MDVIYGISTALVEGLAAEPALEAIAAAGFRQVELLGDANHLDNWPSHPAQTRRLLEHMGLTVRTVHSPSAGWNNGDLDEAARRASVEIAAASFGQAAELGAEIVICHANGPNTPFTAETFRANFERARESLSILAERAKHAGVKMAVENLPSRGLPRPSARVSDVLQLIEGLGDHVGICLDTGHSTANGLSAAAEALEAGDKLLALHIQDNPVGNEDLHYLPGRGATDWEAFLAALERMAFAGVRTFEISARDGWQPTLAALAELRRQWEGQGA